MDTHVRTPQDIFLQPQHLVVPPFQRPYVWDKDEQWAPLWQDVRLLDLFTRGYETVRGFQAAGFGPRDTLSANQDALGGRYYYAVTAETLAAITKVITEETLCPVGAEGTQGEFERRFAEMHGRKYGLAVNGGTVSMSARASAPATNVAAIPSSPPIIQRAVRPLYDLAASTATLPSRPRSSALPPSTVIVWPGVNFHGPLGTSVGTAGRISAVPKSHANTSSGSNTDSRGFAPSGSVASDRNGFCGD